MASTKHTVLGSLVDRAICMPFAKPQRLGQGYRLCWDVASHQWFQVATLEEDAEHGARFLHASVMSDNAEEEWSPARLSVDPAGPWWAATVDEFRSLDVRERGWVLRRLIPTVKTAGCDLTQTALSERWQWLWSQPSFVQPGDKRPQISRPDLVAGLSAHRCLVVDIKTTSGSLSAVDYNPASFDLWAKNLTSLGFTVVGSWVFAVSSVEPVSEWIDVSRDSRN